MSSVAFFTSQPPFNSPVSVGDLLPTGSEDITYESQIHAVNTCGMELGTPEQDKKETSLPMSFRHSKLS